MLAQLTRLFRPDADRLKLHALYEQIVEQARLPRFYQELGVPDTLDSRFDLIVLHLHLVLARLKHASFDSYPQQQALIEIFFEDMDRSIREMGVGDTGVGRRVKHMANAFYGRMQAYDAAESSEGTWQEALQRNIYGDAMIRPDQMAGMLTYVQEARTSLEMQDAQALLSGAPLHFHS